MSALPPLTRYRHTTIKCEAGMFVLASEAEAREQDAEKELAELDCAYSAVRQRKDALVQENRTLSAELAHAQHEIQSLRAQIAQLCNARQEK